MNKSTFMQHLEALLKKFQAEKHEVIL